MKDRVPTKILANGAIRYGVYDTDGKLLRYEYLRLEDEPTQDGTALCKANLLSDETCALLGLADTAVPDDVLGKLIISNFDGDMWWWSKYRALYVLCTTGETKTFMLNRSYDSLVTMYAVSANSSTGEITATVTTPPQWDVLPMNFGGAFSCAVKDGNYYYALRGTTTMSYPSDYVFCHTCTGHRIGTVRTARGSFLADVSAAASNTYPSNGVSGSYYYVAQGHLTAPTKNALRRTVLSSLVALGTITAAQFKTATGEDYVAGS